MVSVWFWAVGGAALLLVLIVVGIFNRIITLQNRCDESWADVDAELQRRYALIPNLVRTVKGYAKHEQELLKHLTDARSRAVSSQGRAREQARDETPVVQDLRRVLALAEAYPDLKASDQFLRLQRELAITEDRLQAARRFYNANVRDLRNATRSFPGNVVAARLGLEERDFFEVEPAIRRAPTVATGDVAGGA